MKTVDRGNEVILCISMRHHGQVFLEELCRLGCRVVLLTLEDMREADWPQEAIEEIQTMPGGMTQEQIQNTVCYLARTRSLARIVALSASDANMAAALREHMRISGMGQTTVRYFTDVLAMRTKAARLGARVVAFAPILNYDDLRAFLENVPAPWILRPRDVVSGEGAQGMADSEQVWRALDVLGDRQSDFLLEQSIPGEIFTAYGICAEGKMQSNIVRAENANSQAEQVIRSAHAELIPALGMLRGAVRTRFLRSQATGTLYFLETIPEPGDAWTVESIEQTNGINLWREWARAEAAGLHDEAYPSSRT